MQALRDALSQGDAVIFVGSGVSRWSGLPSWRGLIEELAQYLDRVGIDSTIVLSEANGGDLLQAASYGFAKLTKPQIADFIRRATRLGTAVPADLHQKVVSLGPSCFITTNYDDLIEQAISKWFAGPPFRRPVTNRQLIEQAEILHAQARRFIFKPHGDANDIETVVLTREQYRMLLPDGEYSATLTTLKTLLASRPVIFIGFGLRDPDFLYVRDLLANIYRGGVRDHYAIVPAPAPSQLDYWRQFYGVHLVGYEVTIRADKTEDHSALLTLLDDLAMRSPPLAVHVATVDLNDPATVLALARYGASLLSLAPNVTPFSIHVEEEAQGSSEQDRFASLSHFNGWSGERFLLEGPPRAILKGSPGAGKTFALRTAATKLAATLQDACMNSKLSASTVFPAIVDLKVYKGSLRSDLESAFPPSLTLASVSACLHVKLFLDAFNEMPREYLENGKFLEDIGSLLSEFPNMGVIIGSRSADGLGSLNLPIFELSSIAVEEVERILKQSGVAVPAHRYDDIVRILQRPFYFRLLQSSSMALQEIAGPGDLYTQYIRHLEKEFAGRFPGSVDIVGALRQQAYRALEEGSEAFPIPNLMAELSANGANSSDAEQMINWLVARHSLIPLAGRRGAFAHQSVTEFLAATELSNRLQREAANIRSIITLRRWDHAIFLTLSLLDTDRATQLLKQLVSWDLSLAINGARYLEHAQEALLEKLIDALVDVPEAEFGRNAELAFEHLPLQPSHERALRSLRTRGGIFESAAIGGLARALGKSMKEELFGLLAGGTADAIQRTAATAIAPHIEKSDIARIVEQVMKLDARHLEDDSVASSMDIYGTALSRLSPDDLRSEIFNKIKGNADADALLAALLCEVDTPNYGYSAEMYRMRNELVRRGFKSAVFRAYLDIKYHHDEPGFALDQVDEGYIATVASFIREEFVWATELLRALCSLDRDISEKVAKLANEEKTDFAVVFRFCSSGNEQEIFATLSEIAKRATVEIGYLASISLEDLNWADKEKLMVELLRLKDVRLSRMILGGTIPVTIEGLATIHLGEPLQWLDWILDLKKTGGREGWWLTSQISSLVGGFASSDELTFLLSILSDEDSPYREIVSRMVLRHAKGVSTDQLSEQAIAYLLSGLETPGASREFEPHLLALIGTEEFFVERLIPWAVGKSEDCLSNVRNVLDVAGRRFGRRFILESEIMSN